MIQSPLTFEDTTYPSSTYTPLGKTIINIQKEENYFKLPILNLNQICNPFFLLAKFVSISYKVNDL